MEDVIARVIAEVRPYTVVPDEGLAATIKLTLDTITKGIAGDLVECGVWRGGCSFAMLLAQRYAFGEILRPVWMYDSFEGMSPPVEQDGEHGAWWFRRSQTVPEDPDKQNYCKASVEEVLAGACALDLLLGEHFRIWPGWFNDTLGAGGAGADRPDKIAVLRVDCDWYEPCKIVLNALVPNVSTGGVIIMDDYYTWEGCILATHEYLAENKLPWMVRTISNHAGAWMLKVPATW